MKTLVILVGIWGVLSLLQRLAKQHQSPQGGAAKLREKMRQAYATPDQYVSARLSDFPHLDHGVALWLLLVVFFVAVYSWTGSGGTQ